MRFLFLTTTDVQSDRAADLARMIGTMRAGTASGIAVHHILLLQRCSEEQRLKQAAAMPYPATVLASPGRHSLSAARNIILAHARAAGLLSADTIVGFPDDDCWYEPELLPSLQAAFRSDPDLGLLVSRVSSSPRGYWTSEAHRDATAVDVLRRSNSGSMFIRGDVVAAIGDFDPSLGLGTPLMSGEDTDFALRASFLSRRTVFVDQPLVGHRDLDLQGKAKYFGGNLQVASRYALKSPSLFGEFARKFAVGGYLVLRQRLKIGDFLNAVVASFRCFGQRAG